MPLTYGIDVHGSRERDFAAMVGGVRNVDPLTGYWMSRINPNSIEEIEVITAGAGVEFGRAQGGFARILQKQGSNEHEGVFEFFYRTSEFDRLPEDPASLVDTLQGEFHGIMDAESVGGRKAGQGGQQADLDRIGRNSRAHGKKDDEKSQDEYSYESHVYNLLSCMGRP